MRLIKNNNICFITKINKNYLNKINNNVKLIQNQFKKFKNKKLNPIKKNILNDNNNNNIFETNFISKKNYFNNENYIKRIQNVFKKFIKNNNNIIIKKPLFNNNDQNNNNDISILNLSFQFNINNNNSFTSFINFISKKRKINVLFYIKKIQLYFLNYLSNKNNNNNNNNLNNSIKIFKNSFNEDFNEDFNNNNNNFNNNLNDFISLLTNKIKTNNKKYFYYILKQNYSFYIKNFFKLKNFFNKNISNILLLNLLPLYKQISLFDFIGIFSQIIIKNYQEFIFYKIKYFNLSKINNNNINIINNNFNNNNLDSFYLNSIKLHLNLNSDIDNKEILPTNLIKKFLLSIFPKNFFSPFQNVNIINFIPKISQEKLISFNFLSNEENLDSISNYIIYLLKIKYNLNEISYDLIKNRLQREKEKNINFNLFYLTKFSELLFNDIINNNLCSNCYCKFNENCEKICECHNLTEPEIEVENNLFKYEEFENNFNIESNKNINNINSIESANNCDYTSNMKEDVEIYPKNKNNYTENNNDCMYKINKVTVKKLNNLFISKGSNNSKKSGYNYSNNSEKKVYKFSLNKSNSKEGKKIRERYYSINNDFN